MKFKIALLMVTVIGSISFAQVTAKHPRVAEVENNLIKDGTTFLKGRFPDLPFMISVSIDPMRRNVDEAPAVDSKLPYYEDDTEDMVDEWDNPRVSVYSLMARIKKASVTVSVPGHLNDEEVTEIRESMFQALNLVAVRDTLIVQRRAWSISKTPPPDDKTMVIFGAIGLVIVAAALAGLYAVTRNSVKLMSDSIASQTAKAAASGDRPMMTPQFANRETNHKSSGQSHGGDITLKDPFKLREVIRDSHKHLVDSGAFPILDDMLELQMLAENNPKAFNALMSEFSNETRAKLFGLSSGETWLKAMNEHGELSSEIVDTLLRMARTHRSSAEYKLQNLLVCVWRLGDSLPAYLRAIDNDEAMAILLQLPKNLSVSAARQAFPGNWASVLDMKSQPKSLTSLNVERLTQKALQLVPLRDETIILKYKREQELLDYLKVADPDEEREVYLASPSDSAIHHSRPPFYVVFSASAKQLDALVPQVSLEDWALALLNTKKSDRKEIEKRFSEKQRFLFIEKLRGFDAQTPEKLEVGEARERIGRVFSKVTGALAENGHHHEEATSERVKAA